ncbi:transducin family protein [Salix suchowensis]|nr:transducin family protein [Salix suchowensis]
MLYCFTYTKFKIILQKEEDPLFPKSLPPAILFIYYLALKILKKLRYDMADPSMSLLAASGGDTVNLFNVSVEPGDLCTLSYTPTPGCVVNSVKWNHTNLVVASAGEDKKISFFSDKGSRYICSGGSGPVVRIWDLQRKRCAMYNCKDEHLASISLSGDLILHNLASGGRATELKDPHEQVLRVLDYSRVSRHLLVTAGDDGSVHLFVSWLNQHSAPMLVLASHRQMTRSHIIASVGLDKKLYTYETPFSSLAFRDDGLVLAAGTSSGRVVFYDVRGKPQPFTVIRAYGSSEVDFSSYWFFKLTCDSILMPDPLPSVTSSSVALSTSVSGYGNTGRPGLSIESTSLTATTSGLASTMSSMTLAEETLHRSHLWPGTLIKLNPNSSYNFKYEMEVFSPLVDVQPITPLLDKFWDDHEGLKKGNLSVEKKPSSLLFPSSSRRFPFQKDGTNDYPIFDWKSSSTSRQNDARSFTLPGGSTPSSSSKSDDSSITPPEAWGDERLSDKTANLHQPLNLPSRFAITSGSSALGSMFSGLQDLPSSTSQTGTGSFQIFTPWIISTTASFSDGASLSLVSPKTKKTRFETREELLNSILSRSDALAVTEPGILPGINGGATQPHQAHQRDTQQGSSFTLRLFQRTLEETLDSFQKSIHEDMRSLHIEVLRQFHMQEMGLSGVMNSILENQAELMKELSLPGKKTELRKML